MCCTSYGFITHPELCIQKTNTPCTPISFSTACPPPTQTEMCERLLFSNVFLSSPLLFPAGGQRSEPQQVRTWCPLGHKGSGFLFKMMTFKQRVKIILGVRMDMGLKRFSSKAWECAWVRCTAFFFLTTWLGSYVVSVIGCIRNRTSLIQLQSSGTVFMLLLKGSELWPTITCFFVFIKSTSETFLAQKPR